ncbi:hypothetical protein R3P38DRAFT_3593227 [Favolaschia claudopus]|uniref:Uncharacterized protein n=1 Tax=Favolaschia claudopus TaxID=2862362 RepID=A0AAW0AG11_9AGAR
MSLPPRGPCLHEDCRSSASCAGFICQASSGDFVDRPHSLATQCACVHPYGNHAALQPQNITGAPPRYEHLNAGCGGFFILSQLQFNPVLPCSYCGKAWMAHSSFSSLDLPRPPASAPPPPPPPSSMSEPTEPAHYHNPFATRMPASRAVGAVSAPVHDPPAMPLINKSAGPSNPFASAARSHPSDSLPSTSASATNVNVFARSSSSLPPPANVFARVTSNAPAQPPISNFERRVSSGATVQTLRTESLQRISERSPSRSSSRQSGLVDDNFIPRPGAHVFQVCLLPFKNEKQYYRNGEPIFDLYSMRTSDSLPSLLRTLTKWNLVANIHVTSDVDLWSQLDRYLREHLTKHGIRLAESLSVQEGSSPYERRAWDMYIFRSNDTAKNRKLSEHCPVERQWTLASISKLLTKCLHPTQKHLEIMFVAPKYDNLWGPRSSYDIDQHPCFPWRVYWSDFNVEDDAACDCISGCPYFKDHDDNDNNDYSDMQSSPMPTPRLKRVASRSPPEAVDAGSSKRLRLRELSPPAMDFPPPANLLASLSKPTIPTPAPTILPLPTPLLPEPTSSALPLAAPATQVAQFDAVNAMIATPSVQELIAAERTIGKKAVQPLTADQVLTWRTDVCSSIPDSTIEALSISGPTAEATAAALRSMISYVHQHAEDDASSDGGEDGAAAAAAFVAPDGIHMNLVPLAGLLHGQRTVRIYSDPNRPLDSGATGYGPERAIFVQGLKLCLADSRRWGDSDGMYKRPIFQSFEGYSDAALNSAFRVDGAWAALYLTQIGVGPDPLCPFLLIALSQKDRSWLSSLSLEYVNLLDPSAARALAPWFAIKPSDVVPAKDLHRHPAVTLVAVYLPNVNINVFCATRDESMHNAIRLSVFSAYLFGRADPYIVPEFQEMQKGFAVPLTLTNKKNFLTHCKKIEPFKRLIASVYNRRVQSVDDVISRLHFRAPLNYDRQEDLRRTLFQLRVLRWLKGTGYPRALRGQFVGAQEFRAQQTNRLLRAEALLHSITGIRFLLPDAEFDLTIELVRVQGKTESLAFHDCSTCVEIYLNSWTDNLLLEDVDFDDPTVDTRA